MKVHGEVAAGFGALREAFAGGQAADEGEAQAALP